MTVPQFSEMSLDQCNELLERSRVGRLAFALHDAVDVVPISYRFKDNRIYGRTSPGGKLATLDRNRRVAFEVDEASSAFAWKSVVVHGSFYVLDAEATATRQQLAELFPDAFAEGDPIAFRNQFFAITIETVTGRSAAAGDGEKKPVAPGKRPKHAPDVEQDTRLRDQVMAEIGRIAADGKENIRCAVENGVVILTGAVSDARLRSAIEDGVASLAGVRGIVQEVEVEWPVKARLTPTEVALHASDAIGSSLKTGHVVAILENGWIRLEGHAPTAEHDRIVTSLQHLAGSRGVIDRIKSR